MATVLESQPATATGVYARLGVKTFINASGHNTAQGGSLMPPEVLAAMQEAAGAYVSLRALQEAAGARIAGITGVPAALVSAGAAGAILLAAAAALTGTDAEKIVALPETLPGARNEFVVWSAARPNYMYQACQAAGGKLAEVGRGSAAMSAGPLCEAIGERTAGVLLVLAPIDISLGRGANNALLWPELIGEVCRVAGAAGVPVLVDAASELPPRDLLRRLIDSGVAGVIASGGKAIRGPQASGILAGRADLIAAAHLNNNPLAAIGRPMKVGKEEICGLVAAVERFFALDEAAQLAGWDAAARRIAGAVPAGKGIAVRVIADDPGYGRPPLVPKAVLTPEGGAAAVEALAAALLDGDPAISPLRQGEHLIFNPMTLMPGEDETVAARLAAVLSA
jgi:D-glucosaminate-6-phosphate ammonia-lyase